MKPENQPWTKMYLLLKMVIFRSHLCFQEGSFKNHRYVKTENPRLPKSQNTSTFLFAFFRLRRCSRWQVRNLRMLLLVETDCHQRFKKNDCTPKVMEVWFRQLFFAIGWFLGEPAVNFQGFCQKLMVGNSWIWKMLSWKRQNLYDPPVLGFKLCSFRGV